MNIGAHVSIAGGMFNAPLTAAKWGCEVFQMFSRSPQGGPPPKLTDELLEQFFAACTAGGFKEWVIHAPYYINLGNPEERIRNNSIRIIREELERATILQAKYVMFHVGSTKGATREQGLAWAVEGLKAILKGYTGSAQLLIEISAGAGEVIGDTFEEIAEMIEKAGPKTIGVCFDTQHAFASGYDLRTPKNIEVTFKKFDQTIGLERLKISHCNDSKIPFNGHKDRHEHLGKGEIGEKGFKALINSPLLNHVNWYIETEYDFIEDDIKLMKKLRKKA